MKTDTQKTSLGRDSADESANGETYGRKRFGFLSQPYAWTAAAYAVLQVARWIQLPNQQLTDAVSAIAGLAFSYLLTTSAGFVVTLWLDRSGIARWALSFLAGNALMLIVGAAAAALGLEVVPALGLMIAGSVLLGLLADRGGYRGVHRAGPGPAVIGDARSRWWVIPVLVTIGVVLYWRWESPIPYHPTWDGLLHLAAADNIFGAFSLDIRELSNGFQLSAYLPGLHLRLALADALGSVGILEMLWAGPFVLSPLLTVGTYRLLARIGVPSPIASVLCVLPTFLQFLQKSTSPLAQLTPASEVSALAPAVVLVAIGSVSERGQLRWGVLAGLALLLPLHAIGGVLLLSVLGVSLAWERAMRNRPRFEIGAAFVATAAVLVALLTAPFLVPDTVLDPIGSYASFVPDASVEQRIANLPVWTNVWLFRLALIGATLALVRRRGDTGGVTRLGAVIALGIMYGSLAPIAGFERLHAYVGLATAMGLGLGLIRLARPMVVTRRRVIALASVLAVGVLLLLPSLAEPLQAHRERQIVDSDLDIASSFAEFEVEFWSGQLGAVEPELPVVSDPIGQSIAVAFGQRLTFNGPYLPDAVQEDLVEALRSTDSVDIQRRLAAIQTEIGTRYLLALSARSYWWAYGRAGTFDFAFRPRLFSALPSDRVAYAKVELIRRFPDCATIASWSEELVLLSIDCQAP